MKNGALLALAAGAGALAASAASADVIASFGYTDLSGGYTMVDPNNGTFAAAAANVGTLQSSGDVTRLLAPGGTAQFETGFVSLADMSDFSISISFSRVSATEGTGAGRFTATDASGDTLSGSISGTWLTPGFGITFFNGLLSSVVFTDGDGGADNTFESPDGGFVMDDLTGFYSGALVQLFTNTGGTFFTTNFSGISTQVSGEIVPTPGAAGLLGLGMLFGMSRRRK